MSLRFYTSEIALGATVICNSFTPIINTSIAMSIYPNDAKKAEISPLYKKNDSLVKSNYRPVSILTALSTNFEGLLCDQLAMHIYIIALRKSISVSEALQLQQCPCEMYRRFQKST